MSPKTIIGAPPKPEPEEREGFFVNKNCNAFLDTKTNPSKIGVDFKDSKDKLLFKKEFANLHAAMKCIKFMKEFFIQKGTADGSAGNGSK